MSESFVCLMYHDVSEEAPVAGGGPRHFDVSRRAFRDQLQWLRDEGLAGCSLAEALDGPARPRVAITFDDGDTGQYRRAFPELVAAAMTATFFIVTDWVERPGYVGWNDLREMRAAGMSVQSHSRRHPFLSELDAVALAEELRAAKECLDERLEQSTVQIALPGGDAPRRALRPLLRDAGYQVVATSRWGTNRTAPDGGLRWVRRCTVRGTAEPDYFRRVLRGDPWISLSRGVREGALHHLRASLGPTRYARWRRRFLDLLSPRAG